MQPAVALALDSMRRHCAAKRSQQLLGAQHQWRPADTAVVQRALKHSPQGKAANSTPGSTAPVQASRHSCGPETHAAAGGSGAQGTAAEPACLGSPGVVHTVTPSTARHVHHIDMELPADKGVGRTLWGQVT